MMEFTEAEDAAFWPIYRDYEFEMSKLGDERVALIQEYAKTYTQMTDATADALATKALDLESRRQDMKRRYYGRFKQALSAVTAARFLQVEQQTPAAHRSANLRRAADRQIARERGRDDQSHNAVDDRGPRADLRCRPCRPTGSGCDPERPSKGSTSGATALPSVCCSTAGRWPSSLSIR